MWRISKLLAKRLLPAQGSDPATETMPMRTTRPQKAVASDSLVARVDIMPIWASNMSLSTQALHDKLAVRAWTSVNSNSKKRLNNAGASFLAAARVMKDHAFTSTLPLIDNQR